MQVCSYPVCFGIHLLSGSCFDLVSKTVCPRRGFSQEVHGCNRHEAGTPQEERRPIPKQIVTSDSPPQAVDVIYIYIYYIIYILCLIYIYMCVCVKYVYIYIYMYTHISPLRQRPDVFGKRWQEFVLFVLSNTSAYAFLFCSHALSIHRPI